MLVTGLSGAGKASVLNVLEDLGYETVDNPPLAILESLMADGTGPIAAGIDTRTRGFDAQVALETLRRLRERPDVDVDLVYVTADDEILLRRYTETRRRHPLALGGPMGNRVQDGIAREKALLAPLQEAADLVLDTSTLPLPEMRRQVEARFRPEGGPGLSVLVQSFGFPKGLPREADLVFDVRFLQNPHYDAVLRPLTGFDPIVQKHVEADPDFPVFWERLTGLLDPLLPRYAGEGKKYLNIAVGCTGGKHRSVFLTEKLAAHLRGQGWRVESAHRELAGRSDITARAEAAATPTPPPPAAAPAPTLSIPDPAR